MQNYKRILAQEIILFFAVLGTSPLATAQVRPLDASSPFNIHSLASGFVSDELRDGPRVVVKTLHEGRLRVRREVRGGTPGLQERDVQDLLTSGEGQSIVDSIEIDPGFLRQAFSKTFAGEAQLRAIKGCGMSTEEWMSYLRASSLPGSNQKYHYVRIRYQKKNRGVIETHEGMVALEYLDVQPERHCKTRNPIPAQASQIKPVVSAACSPKSVWQPHLTQAMLKLQTMPRDDAAVQLPRAHQHPVLSEKKVLPDTAVTIPRRDTMRSFQPASEVPRPVLPSSEKTCEDENDEVADQNALALDVALQYVVGGPAEFYDRWEKGDSAEDAAIRVRDAKRNSLLWRHLPQDALGRKPMPQDRTSMQAPSDTQQVASDEEARPDRPSTQVRLRPRAESEATNAPQVRQKAPVIVPDPNVVISPRDTAESAGRRAFFKGFLCDYKKKNDIPPSIEHYAVQLDNGALGTFSLNKPDHARDSFEINGNKYLLDLSYDDKFPIVTLDGFPPRYFALMRRPGGRTSDSHRQENDQLQKIFESRTDGYVRRAMGDFRTLVDQAVSENRCDLASSQFRGYLFEFTGRGEVLSVYCLTTTRVPEEAIEQRPNPQFNEFSQDRIFNQ